MKTTLILITILIGFSKAQKTCFDNQNVCYQGSWKDTPQGTQFASFQGIRYAEPPIGNLRFKSPVAYKIPEGTIGNVEQYFFPLDGVVFCKSIRLKKIVKLCLHSCFKAPNSLHFDGFFDRFSKIEF